MPTYNLRAVAERIGEAHGQKRADAFLQFCRTQKGFAAGGRSGPTYDGDLGRLLEAFEKTLPKTERSTDGEIRSDQPGPPLTNAARVFLFKLSASSH